MSKPIETNAATMDYVHQLIAAGHEIAEALGLNGGEVVQGAAIFAGMQARCNARPGMAEVVGEMSAEVVRRLATGRTATIN
ncbi:MAG TPA: hypothetical protein VGV37_13380 [Aliidongia sp.]|uniref:hypothetical protein n=1 Tax=Aliidongia sp. TaxID=1914230 RepID=UPI002DDDB314|nr:hypothetical protein [Aliidongia sp.]HEV2675530.1 hypothetical protein [Aliidongia sp.]